MKFNTLIKSGGIRLEWQDYGKKAHHYAEDEPSLGAPGESIMGEFLKKVE